MTPTFESPKRIIVSIPRHIIDQAIQNNNIGICFRVGGTECCPNDSAARYSNTVCAMLPSIPEPPDGPGCIPASDISGMTLKVSYDPTNCFAGHVCNRALFICNINDISVGLINLNNLGIGPNGEPSGGPRSTSIILPPGTIAINNQYKIELIGHPSLTSVHRGISRIQIIDNDTIIFDECARDDIVNFINIC